MGRSAMPSFCGAIIVLAITHLQAEEKPAAGFKTPQAAFDAYAAAQEKADWKTSWACFTPALQDFQAFESAFGLGIWDPDFEKKFLKPDIKEPAEVPKTVEERQKLLLSWLRDKFTVYAAACDYNAKKGKPIDWKAPLREIEVDGDRAQGVVTRYSESRSKSPGMPEVITRKPWDMPVYFQKTESGWLLDVSTPAEQRRYVRDEVGREADE